MGASPVSILSAADFHEFLDTIQIAQVLRRGPDGGRIACGEQRMAFIRPLGPDLASAPLGERNEIHRAALERISLGAVLKEQPLDRLAGGGSINEFCDGDADGLAGLMSRG